MNTLRAVLSAFALLIGIAMTATAQYYDDGSSWYRFGDWYPTTARPYSDVSNFLDSTKLPRGSSTANCRHLHGCEEAGGSQVATQGAPSFLWGSFFSDTRDGHFREGKIFAPFR